MNLRERYFALTARQRQVLSFVAGTSMTYAEIGKLLGIKASGVSSHVRNLMDTLGAESRLRLAVLVRREIMGWDIQ